jgi:hypothetical protein
MGLALIPTEDSELNTFRVPVNNENNHWNPRGTACQTFLAGLIWHDSDPTGCGPQSTSLMAARGEYHNPPSRHDLGRMGKTCPHCDTLHWVDEHVAASSKHAPGLGMCCNHGKVRLEQLQVYCEMPMSDMRQSSRACWMKDPKWGIIAIILCGDKYGRLREKNNIH